MSHCTFCVTDGGEEGCQKVNDPKAIRFICQQFMIDFEKTFDLEDVNLHLLNSFPLILSLCPKCLKQFEDIRRIQLLLEEMKGQLDKLLSEVRDSVLSSPLQIKEKDKVERLDRGAVGEDCFLSKNCRILRKEIRRTSSIGKPDESGGKGVEIETANHVQVQRIQIKTEETQMYEEEDVEEFQTNNGREFLYQLSKELVIPQVRVRSEQEHLQGIMGIEVAPELPGNIRGIPELAADGNKVLLSTRLRCNYCQKNHKKTTRIGCSKCRNPICSDHGFTIILCPDCQPANDPFPEVHEHDKSRF